MKVGLCAAAAWLCLNSTGLHAAEHKIPRSALPTAVEKTVEANLQGAIIKGFSTEIEGGKKVYEAETILNGHTRDLQIAVDGTLNEIEQQVDFDALPAAVQQAIVRRAAGAKVDKVESITKHDKLVAYEVTIMKGTKRGEIQVGPKGEALRREE